MLCGVMRFDPGILAAAVAALLGGIVIWGSNRSTAMEAVKDLAVAEADQSAMMPSLTKGDKSTLQRRGAAKQSKGRLNLSGFPQRGRLPCTGEGWPTYDSLQSRALAPHSNHALWL